MALVATAFLIQTAAKSAAYTDTLAFELAIQDDDIELPLAQSFTLMNSQARAANWPAFSYRNLTMLD